MYILTLDIPAEKDFPELSAGVLVDYSWGVDRSHTLGFAKGHNAWKKWTKHIINGGARWWCSSHGTRNPLKKITNYTNPSHGELSESFPCKNSPTFKNLRPELRGWDSTNFPTIHEACTLWGKSAAWLHDLHSPRQTSPRGSNLVSRSNVGLEKCGSSL